MGEKQYYYSSYQFLVSYTKVVLILKVYLLLNLLNLIQF